jgi:hypothetical protein
LFRRRDHDVFARQIGWKVAARGALAGEWGNACSPGRSDLAFHLSRTGIGLCFFKGDLELIKHPPTFGTRAIFIAAHLLVHQLKMCVTSLQIGIDGPNSGQFRFRLESMSLRTGQLGAQA